MSELKELAEKYLARKDEFSLRLSKAIATGAPADKETKECVACALAGYMKQKVDLNDEELLFLIKKFSIMTKRLSAESLEKLLLIFAK